MPMEQDPEKRKAGTRVWTDWMASMQDKLVDGLPVMRAGKIARKRSVRYYKPKTNDVSGYFIIKADSIEEAVKIAQSSPHAKMNQGPIVVRECLPVDM